MSWQHQLTLLEHNRAPQQHQHHKLPHTKPLNLNKKLPTMSSASALQLPLPGDSRDAKLCYYTYRYLQAELASAENARYTEAEVTEQAFEHAPNWTELPDQVLRLERAIELQEDLEAGVGWFWRGYRALLSCNCKATPDIPQWQYPLKWLLMMAVQRRLRTRTDESTTDPSHHHHGYPEIPKQKKDAAEGAS
jgi:hypothetical protein